MTYELLYFYCVTSKVFRFKHFSISQEHSAMKVGMDSMMLGAFCDVENGMQILDIGTGTGVLSLMLAQK